MAVSGAAVLSIFSVICFTLTNRFILEGIPAVLVGVLVYFYLPDYPETAKFLTQEERDFAVARMGPYAPKGEYGVRRRVCEESSLPECSTPTPDVILCSTGADA